MKGSDVQICEIIYAGKATKLQKVKSGTSRDAPAANDPKMGIAVANTAPALDLLRALAVTYFVSAQQVDLLCEVFDDPRDKVILFLTSDMHIEFLLDLRSCSLCK